MAAPEPSPEAALLLRAARMDVAVGDMASMPIDWDRLLDLAGRHGMIPLLHRHLRHAHLPGEAEGERLARNAAETRRSLAMAGELRRLMDRFESAGVPAVAYKGPALAVQAYGNPILRSFSDLDLLVHPDDIPRATEVLAAAGYEAEMPLTAAQERWFRRVDGDYPLVHRQSGILVELHARVSTLRFGIDIDTDGLIRRAIELPLGGGTVRTLGDDDLLLVLFVHGAKHRWKRLEWLAAVAALLRVGRGDVDAVLERATELRGRRTVLLGLYLASWLLDAPVSAEVRREAAASPVIRALAEEAVERMFGPDTTSGRETRANLRFNLRLRQGAMEKTRYVARWLFGPTPEDGRWTHLPDALFPLYRVLRPIRLLARHGGPGGDT